MIDGRISRVARMAVAAGVAAGFATARPAAGADEEKGSIRMKSAGIEVGLSRSGGLTVDVDGVAFSDGGSMYVVKRDWSGRHFGFEDDRARMDRVTRAALPDGGEVVTIPLPSPTGTFEGTQTLELHPDRRLVVSFEGRMTSESAGGALENKMFMLQPGWLSGRGLSITHRGPLHSSAERRVTTSTAPLVAPSEDVAKSTLASNFARLAVDSRMGSLVIETDGDAPVSLVDYRRNKWSQNKPYYWFGVLSTNLKGRDPLTYRVTVKFPPARTEASGTPTRGATAPVPLTAALAPETPDDRIIPTPKRVTWGAGDLPLPGAELRLFLPDGKPSVALLAPLNSITEDMAADFTPMSVLVTTRAEPTAGAGAGVAIRVGDDPALPKGQPEAYRLAIGETASLTAATTEGVVHGLRTLAQLVRRQPGGGFALRRCDIVDWPALPFRSIHFFTGNGGAPLQTRFLRDILGPLKVNALVYQADYLRWASMPAGSHHPDRCMEKADAAKVVAEARRQGIDVMPLVNTFGHSEWLLDNAALRDLSDDPADAYAYDPANPKVYELTKAIYQEAVDLFRPTTFHIGHDEVTVHHFPQREWNKKVGATKLFIDDTKFYHAWLKERGIRTAMWGDMLVSPQEAGPDACFAPSAAEGRARRAALPKDIVIADWHYDADAPSTSFTSLKVFTESGFDTIACTWYDPKNILRFHKAAADPAAAGKGPGRVLGGMQTTWAGYSFDQASFDGNPDQYAAYVLAAEAAWTGGAEQPGAVPFDYRAEFARLWTKAALPATGAAGFTLDLRTMARTVVAGDGGTSVGSVGGSAAPRWGRFTFGDPAGAGTAVSAITLASKFGTGETSGESGTSARPSSLALDFSAGRPTTATAIQFAVAADHACPVGLPIATTTILFADGTSDTVTWKMSQTVFALDDARTAPLCPVLWKRDPADPATQPPAVVHGYLWSNPKPGVALKGIRFDSLDRGPALMVFGVTGIQTPG